MNPRLSTFVGGKATCRAITSPAASSAARTAPSSVRRTSKSSWAVSFCRSCSLIWAVSTRPAALPTASRSAWYAVGAGQPSTQAFRNLGLVGLPAAAYCTSGVRCRCPLCFWCCEPRAPPDGSIGLGSVFGPLVGDSRRPALLVRG